MKLWKIGFQNDLLEQAGGRLPENLRRIPHGLEISILAFVFLAGFMLSIVGPISLLALIGLLVIFINNEILIYFLLAALTIDLTWISEYLRFLPDLLILILFFKSLVYTRGVSLTRSAVGLPLFFLACSLALGVILNYQNLQPASIIYGFRVLFLDLLIFTALLRFNFPLSFYKKVIFFLFGVFAIQLPIQLLQRFFGVNWSVIANLSQAPWDNFAGTFGSNGTLKLTSLCMMVFAIALSEITFQKHFWTNVAIIVVVIFSLAISESKYGLLLIPIMAAFLTRRLWLLSLGNILKSIMMVIFILIFFGIGLVNISLLSGANSNYLLNNPTELWNNQFYRGDPTSSQGLPGRLGVYSLVDQYRRQAIDGDLQFIFGNGLGSVSDSSFSMLQGYLFRRFPFDQLGRTDASRIWIELGLFGSLITLWMYGMLLLRASKISAASGSEEEQMMGYATFNCIVIGLVLMPYSPVTMGAISGLMLWLMASMVEGIHGRRQAPVLEIAQAHNIEKLQTGD